MPMIVANNLNAIAAQNSLNKNNSLLSGSLEKLSTGYKINSGKDDPSGLVISEQLRAQNVGLNRAVQNTQEANNVLGIAEGALNEMNNILKKMRQLAIHSANNGVTSPEQVAADQSEVDSSIQTLDRIARTTKFSDQFLLNGNKELGYESSVMISDSNDMKLVNENLSDIRQIFKRDDFKININFSGVTTDGSGNKVDNGNEAQKAYFEMSKAQSSATQVSDTAILTQDQALTLSGNKGSRYLSFATGSHLGEMVSSINSVKDSTGVEATLVFDSDTTVIGARSSDPSTNGVVIAGTTDISTPQTHGTATAEVYNRTELGAITTNGVQQVSVEVTNGLKLGQNIDGHGRAYLKMVDDESYEIFKDESLTMKVAEGSVTATGDTQVMAVNNSGFTGFDMTFGTSGLSAGSTAVLQLGVQMEDVGISMVALPSSATRPNAGTDSTGTAGPVSAVTISSGSLPASMAGGTYWVVVQTGGNSELHLDGPGNPPLDVTAAANSTFNQQLGTVTTSFTYDGETFEVTTTNENGIGVGATSGYSVVGFTVPEEVGTSDAEMVKNSGVNMIDLVNDTDSTTNGSFFVREGSFMSGVSLGENTSETGKVYIKADLNSSADSKVYAYKDERMRDEDLIAESGDVDLTGTTGGAVRMYGVSAGANGGTSGLYGTLNFNQITDDLDLNGSMIEFTNLGLRVSADEYGSDDFVKVDQHEGAIFTRYSEVDGPVLLDAGLAGTEWVEYGRDATISLNGQELKLEGIEGTVTNLDTTAKIAFNEGGLGTTTIAAVGYDEGSWGSRAYQMDDDEDNYISHAIHSTTETLGDFTGGMQFQLGEGSGDQERTVLSVKDMTATQLGRVEFNDEFETELKSDKYLSINDMLSGGWASLARDPVKSLEIIDQAIEDVSELRANIGAFQANMLETNANSLSVAIENISKTESYIRDADMAKESTDFSKNQIMVQAGTSMLAQANQLNQGVMSLLG